MSQRFAIETESSPEPENENEQEEPLDAHSDSLSLPPWRPIIDKSLRKNRSAPHSRYFQIATVDPNGYPSNRTVVFRGFKDPISLIQIITDTRSEKIQHWKNKDAMGNSKVEICWYFTNSREQFRIRGSVLVVESSTIDTNLPVVQQEIIPFLKDKDDKADPPGDLNTVASTVLTKWRETMWKNLSDSARLGFAWSFPGRELEPQQDLEVSADFPLENFALVLVVPEKVDHLQLKGNPQRRVIYTRNQDKSWNALNVNP